MVIRRRPRLLRPDRIGFQTGTHFIFPPPGTNTDLSLSISHVWFAIRPVKLTKVGGFVTVTK